MEKIGNGALDLLFQACMWNLIRWILIAVPNICIISWTKNKATVTFYLKSCIYIMQFHVFWLSERTRQLLAIQKTCLVSVPTFPSTPHPQIKLSCCPTAWMVKDLRKLQERFPILWNQNAPVVFLNILPFKGLGRNLIEFVFWKQFYEFCNCLDSKGPDPHGCHLSNIIDVA